MTDDTNSFVMLSITLMISILIKFSSLGIRDTLLGIDGASIPGGPGVAPTRNGSYRSAARPIAGGMPWPRERLRCSLCAGGSARYPCPAGIDAGARPLDPVAFSTARRGRPGFSAAAERKTVPGCAA